MYHIYFGVFDFVLYAIAGIIAIFLADAICNEMTEREQLETVEELEVSTTQPIEERRNISLILDAQLFELHGTLVVRKGDIPASLPSEISALSLRGDPVIRLTDLCHTYGTVVIDVKRVLHKWSQQKKKPKKRSQKPVEKAALNGGSGYGTTSALTV